MEREEEKERPRHFRKVPVTENTAYIKRNFFLTYPYWDDYIARRTGGFGDSKTSRTVPGWCRETMKPVVLRFSGDCGQAREEADMYIYAGKHPCLLPVQRAYNNVVSRASCLVFVFERFYGGDLFDRVMRAPRQPLTEARVGEITMMVMEVLEFFEMRNMAHMSLYPQNIWMTDKTDKAQIKIVDFSYAKAFYDDYATDVVRVRRLKLENMYLDCKTKGALAKQYDLYCLGHMIYFMICGHHAYQYPEFKAVTERERREEFHNGMLSMTGLELYPFPLRDWLDVSPECTEFVDGIINHENYERKISLDKALTHPWVTTVYKTRTTPHWTRQVVTVKHVEKFRKRACSVSDATLIQEQGGYADLIPLMRSTAGRRLEDYEVEQISDGSAEDPLWQPSLTTLYGKRQPYGKELARQEENKKAMAEWLEVLPNYLPKRCHKKGVQK